MSNGTNVNQQLVKDGWCWWYRKYAPGDTVLEGLENEAREGRRGLWVDPQPVPPWEWRKRKERSLTAVKSSMFSWLNNALIEPPQPTFYF